MPTDAQIAIIKSWQAALIAAAVRDSVPNPLPKFGADGLGGAETQTAINDFQKRHGLPVTGQLDGATQKALTPPAPVTLAEVAEISEGLSHLPFVPDSIKEILMFPTLVQLAVALLPGIPDDINAVKAELTELASTDQGVAKVRSFIAFARQMLDAAQEVVDKIDPQGTVAPSTPVPAPAATAAPAAAK